jgi:hypothetical protein
MARKMYKTTNPSMSKRQARRAIKSKGMIYPATLENKTVIASSVDDFLNTLRRKDPKTGKVVVTRKGKRAIRKARRKQSKKTTRR